jgi:alpha-mannosidase
MPHISNTSHAGDLPLKAQLLSCKGACTTIVKCSRDNKSVTVRLYNPKDDASEAVLTFCKEIRSAKLADSAEYEVGKVDFSGNTAKINIGLKELKTLTFEL